MPVSDHVDNIDISGNDSDHNGDGAAEDEGIPYPWIRSTGKGFAEFFTKLGYVDMSVTGI
jgi:hypothetical protein